VRLAYNAVLLALLLLCSPLLAVALLFWPRGRAGLGERLRPLASGPGASVWVHAASVGEVEAAAPLIAALQAAGRSVRATASSVAGRERLRALAPRAHPRLAPLDLPGLVEASLRRAGIATLVLIETELWPNLVWAAASRGARLVLLSARISDRSLPRYRRLRALLAPLLHKFAAIGARSAQDRERLIALGAVPQRCSVVGDLKLARGAPRPPSPELREALGAGPFLLGGSTHPGEEAALLRAWNALRGSRPGLRLLLAPRHLERVPRLLEELRGLGAPAGLRSRGAQGAEVVVIDSFGELGPLYHLAALVFVGGSLSPVGGHNLLEPVLAGRVVVHGPHVHNQRAQLELLRPLGVLHEVADAEQLARVLVQLWTDPERDAPARAARAALAPGEVVARSLALVLGDGAVAAAGGASEAHAG
jgi:3-deoxy-D-manno-octulosonic-acid transferase